MNITSSFIQIANMSHINKVLQGSQGAAKTVSVLMKWVLTASKSNTKELCSIISDTFPNLRTGAIKDFEMVCNLLSIPFESTKSPCVFKVNNWTFEFFSVDKESKGLGGRRDRLFINEANRVSWKIARQLIARTHKERIFDFNPSRKFWVHEQYVDTNDCDFVKLTYKDNQELPESEIESIERHAPWGKVPDPNYWRVYGLGEIGFVEGAIFNNVEQYTKLPEGKKSSCFGVDFGYTNPMASVLVHYHKETKAFYWYEVFYAKEASHIALSSDIKSNEYYNKQQIICDGASPREVIDLRKPPHFLSSIKASGGPVTVGIRRLKQYKIYVHKDSNNLLKEMSLYSWQEKNGEIIEHPIDKDNHLIDAARYASTFLLNIS